MNYLIGDSRVRGVKQFLSTVHVNEVCTRPGGKIEQMYQLVDELTYLHHGINNERAHFYIWVGICNLTKREKGMGYEEVIFSSEAAVISRVRWVEELSKLAKYIRNQYGSPIFVPIYPMELSKWNYHRLNSNKTKFLLHTEKYTEMQKDLEIEVNFFNKQIVALKNENGVRTPMVNKDFFHSRGKGRTTPRYGELPDGCHASSSLNGKFKKSIMNAINKNSNLQRS